MEKEKIVLLLHKEYYDGEHGYTLYEIPKDRFDEAQSIAYEAGSEYENQEESMERLEVEDFLEKGLEKAGIEYRCLEYGVAHMETE